MRVLQLFFLSAVIQASAAELQDEGARQKNKVAEALFEQYQETQRRIDELSKRMEELLVEVQMYKRSNRQTNEDFDKRIYRLEKELVDLAQPPQREQSAEISGLLGASEATPTDAQRATAANEEEEASYAYAFDLLINREYAKAEFELRSYIESFPDGSYSAQASYWLAETYYVQGKFDLALARFDRLIAQHPGNERIPESLLKKGFCLLELGRKAEGEKVLAQVVASYPQSTVAGLARNRLKILN